MIENGISEPVSTVEVLKHHPHDATRDTDGIVYRLQTAYAVISKTLSSTEAGVIAIDSNW